MRQARKSSERVPWLIAAAAIAAAGLVTIASTTTPARADHVQEPTSPITGVEWRVYDYPRIALQACGHLVDAGAEPHVFSEGGSLRFELDVSSEAQPSEHWVARFTLSKLTKPGARNEKAQPILDWFSRHANQPAHSRRAFEMWQNNFYNLEAGTYLFTVHLTGLESGNVVSDECRVTVAGSGENPDGPPSADPRPPRPGARAGDGTRNR